jgi:uncharacterized membrane protein
MREEVEVSCQGFVQFKECFSKNNFQIVLLCYKIPVITPKQSINQIHFLPSQWSQPDLKRFCKYKKDKNSIEVHFFLQSIQYTLGHKLILQANALTKHR